MAYCRHCGQAIEEGQAYCRVCGKPVAKSGQQRPGYDQAIPVARDGQAAGGPQPTQPLQPTQPSANPYPNRGGAVGSGGASLSDRLRQGASAATAAAANATDLRAQ